MPTIEDDILIDAPIEDVYEYIRIPKNHEEFIPSLIEISDVEPLDDGHEGQFRYKILGVELTASFHDRKLIPPEQRVFDVTGDIEATITYEFDAVDEGTRLTYINDYEPFQSGIMGTITQPMVDKYLQRETNSQLQNIKTLLEEQ